tara:strand:- start:49 stop:231 length:183 start_codon:yes stop_codon:yes gene_type:complete
MRDKFGISEWPTAKLAILKPRLLKSPEMRVSTPGLSLTSAVMVWLSGLGAIEAMRFPQDE